MDGKQVLTDAKLEIEMKQKNSVKVLRSTPETVGPLVNDWKDMQDRKSMAKISALLAVAQVAVLVVQVIGVLSDDDHFLLDNGSRDTVEYHVVVSVQSFLVIMQLVFMTRWYILRVRNLSHFDHLWADIGLLGSGQRNSYIFEMLILSLHEPPGLVLAWNNSYKIQILSLLRVYVFFTFLRAYSITSTQGGRLICTIARVSNNKALQVRTWMYEYPIPFLSSCTILGWIVLSLSMFMAEEGELSFDDACWLTFITMTTVGYGDFSPSTQVGRLISCITALHGLVSSALLISVVANLFSLNPQQQRVIEFLTESNMHGTIEDLAVRIIQVAWRSCKGSIRGRCMLSYKEHLKHLCAEHRRAKRHFKQFRSSIHSRFERVDMDVKLVNLERHMKVLLDGFALQARPVSAQSLAQGVSPVFSTPRHNQPDFEPPKQPREIFADLSAQLRIIADNQEQMKARQDRLEGHLLKLLGDSGPGTPYSGLLGSPQ